MAEASGPAETERSQPARKGDKLTLLVGNLPSVSPRELEGMLRESFSVFGNVRECEVLRDDAGESRGYAFLRMQSGQDTVRAKAKLDGAYLRPPSKASEERPMRIRWSLDTATLFVGDLGPEVQSDRLREAFSQFGNVLDCRVERAPDELGGASRCYGFVEFSTRAVAARVQQLLSDNLFLLSNSPRPLRVEFAVDAGYEDEEVWHSGHGVDKLINEEPPPHFAQPGQLEFDFALRWRELSLAHKAETDRLAELHRQEREVLRQEQAEMFKHEHFKFVALQGGGSGSSTASRNDFLRPTYMGMQPLMGGIQPLPPGAIRSTLPPPPPSPGGMQPALRHPPSGVMTWPPPPPPPLTGMQQPLPALHPNGTLWPPPPPPPPPPHRQYYNQQQQQQQQQQVGSKRPR